MAGGDVYQTTSTSSSTGTITLAATATDANHRPFPAAWDGEWVSVRIDHVSVQAQFEIVKGKYTHSGRTLTRPAANVSAGTAGAGANTDFDAGGLIVSVVPRWEDVAQRVPTSVKTSAYQVVVGDPPIRTDTSGGGFTVTLPASPSDGYDTILEDAAEGGSWNSANPVLLVTSDGSTLAGNVGADGVNHDGGSSAVWRYNLAEDDWAYVGAAGGGGTEGGGAVDSVNGQTGVVVLDATSIDVAALSPVYVTPDDGSVEGWLGGIDDAIGLRALAADPVFTGSITIPDGALAIADTSGLQTALDAKVPKVGAGTVVSDLELKDIAETAVAKGGLAGAVSFDYTAGPYQWGTLTGDITSVAIANPPASGKAGTLTIEIVNDSTPHSIVWGAAFDYEPELTQSAGAIDRFVLQTRDGGTTWHVSRAHPNATDVEIAALSPVNYTPASTAVEGHLEGVDDAIGDLIITGGFAASTVFGAGRTGEVTRALTSRIAEVVNVGDFTPGRTYPYSGNDQAGVEAAIAVANAIVAGGPRARLWFPPIPGAFVLNALLPTISPRVDVIMDASLAFPQTVAASDFVMKIGSESEVNKSVHLDLWLNSWQAQDYANLEFGVVQLLNIAGSNIRTRSISGAPIGLQFKATGNLYCFSNQVHLGEFEDQEIGVDLVVDPAVTGTGWITNLNFYGGGFSSNGIHAYRACFRARRFNLGVNANLINACTFFGPRLEIGGGSSTGFDLTDDGCAKFHVISAYIENVTTLMTLRGTAPKASYASIRFLNDYDTTFWARSDTSISEPDVVSDSNWSQSIVEFATCPTFIPMTSSRNLGPTENYFLTGNRGIIYTGAGHTLTVNKMHRDGTLMLKNGNGGGGANLTIANGTATQRTSVSSLTPGQLAMLTYYSRGVSYDVIVLG